MTAVAMAADKPPVLLIDLSAIFHAAWHASENGPMSGALSATLAGVRRCQQMVPGALVGVCCDGRGNWRKELSPVYKAHREKQPEAMYGALDKVKAQLVADGYLLWTADGFEADDLLGAATLTATNEGHDVVIATHDKDAIQLLGPTVRMLKTTTWEFFTADDCRAKFSISPDWFGDWLALVGDKGDNVAGVPSVGAVTASKLLTDHISLANLYAKVDALPVYERINTEHWKAAPPTVTPAMRADTKFFVATKTPDAAAIGTPAIVEKLWRHREDAMLARKLVELRTDAPLRFEDIYEERKVTTKKNTGNVDLDADENVPISRPPVASSTETAPVAGAATASAQETSTTTQTTSNGTATSPTPSATAAPTAAATTQPSTASDGESRALAPVVAVEYEHALEPRTAQQALTLGEVLNESRAYGRFPTAAAITATVMRGRELGIPALASLDAFHFMTDMARIAPGWQVIITLAERSPQCEYIRWVCGDGKSATWETKHRNHPEPARLTYTIEQAELVGLTTMKPGKQPGPWLTRPDEMLRKSAGVQLARVVYPGATLGLYADFELEG